MYLYTYDVIYIYYKYLYIHDIIWYNHPNKCPILAPPLLAIWAPEHHHFGLGPAVPSSTSFDHLRPMAHWKSLLLVKSVFNGRFKCTIRLESWVTSQNPSTPLIYFDHLVVGFGVIPVNPASLLFSKAQVRQGVHLDRSGQLTYKLPIIR